MGNTEQRPWERPKERERVRLCTGLLERGLSQKTSGTALDHPPMAAFSRHTCAHSNTQVPGTIAEQEALTMVATAWVGERSSLLRLLVYYPCEVQDVPPIGLVDFFQALSAFSGCLHLCS